MREKEILKPIQLEYSKCSSNMLFIPLHLAIVDTEFLFYFQTYERQNAALMSDNDDKN